MAFPNTHLTHKLVHTLSALKNQVVLGRERVEMCGAFHLLEVLPVFYLEGAHTESLGLWLPHEKSEITPDVMLTRTDVLEFSKGRKISLDSLKSFIKFRNHLILFHIKTLPVPFNSAWRKGKRYLR